LNDGRLIGGYTTRDHLLLDLDTAFVSKALSIAHMVIHDYPDVGNCLVLQSSAHGFHHVYGARLGWSRIVHVTETLAGLHILNADYMKIRKFRHDLTLRINTVDRGKGVQPEPNVICTVPNYGNPCMSGIMEYLETRGILDY
jgi:hypothetical protein